MYHTPGHRYKVHHVMCPVTVAMLLNEMVTYVDMEAALLVSNTADLHHIGCTNSLLSLLPLFPVGCSMSVGLGHLQGCSRAGRLVATPEIWGYIEVLVSSLLLVV
jgi:hypothetical protein